MFILLIKSTGEKSHKKLLRILFKAFLCIDGGVKVIQWREDEELFTISREKSQGKKSVACSKLVEFYD
jgi:hypothetical protein